MTGNHDPAISEEEGKLSKECQELLLFLPKQKAWNEHSHQYLYQGFWCHSPLVLQAVISFQNHFQARDSDIIIASLPKCGTTWLKALTFAVVNRHRFDIETHPLLTSNSHPLVPFLDMHLYINNQIPDFSSDLLPDPRLFGTHMPFPSLGTIKDSNCKIVYVCRNPFDSFVSYWHFFNKERAQFLDPPLSLVDAFDRYCPGTDIYGPFWYNILGYWEERLKRPNNVLFFMYEDMKKDVSHLKTLVKFLEMPFTEEEERNGVIVDIAKLCSFEIMKDLDINKTGTFRINRLIGQNNNLFRKAEVGDWVNYFTPDMEERMSKLIEEKFGDSGLKFRGIPGAASYVPN